MGGAKKYYFRKNLFGGFNREDVIKYMADQSKEAVAEHDALMAELAALRQTREDLAAEVEKLRSEISRASEELESKDNKIASLSGENSVMREIARKRTSEAEQAAGRLEELETRCAGLNADVEAMLTSFGDQLSDRAFSCEETKLLASKIAQLAAQNEKMREDVEKVALFRDSFSKLFGKEHG